MNTYCRRIMEILYDVLSWMQNKFAAKVFTPLLFFFLFFFLDETHNQQLKCKHFYSQLIYKHS